MTLFKGEVSILKVAREKQLIQWNDRMENGRLLMRSSEGDKKVEKFIQSTTRKKPVNKNNLLGSIILSNKYE